MSELEIKEPFYETRETEEESGTIVIFKKELHEKIKKDDFTLSENIFEVPLIKKLLKRDKNEIIVISDKEKAIDIKDSRGEVVLPLLQKANIMNEKSKLENKNNITYKNVRLEATEIIVKAYFQEGINTELELMLVDERIIEPKEASIVTQMKGNLIYQQLRFIIKPDYSVRLSDQNIDRAYTLYYKLKGIELVNGSKVMSIRCKNAYIISNKHTVKIKNKLKKINIENSYDELLKEIPKDITSFPEIELKTPEIRRDRIQKLGSMRRNYLEGESSNQLTTRNIQASNLINISQYFVKGKLKHSEKELEILIDSGASINMIDLELVKNIKLQESRQEWIQAKRKFKSLGKVNIIVTIASQEIAIEFEVGQENINKCILGIPWLETVKPWNIGSNELKFTHKGIEFKTKRISKNYYE